MLLEGSFMDIDPNNQEGDIFASDLKSPSGVVILQKSFSDLQSANVDGNYGINKSGIVTPTLANSQQSTLQSKKGKSNKYDFNLDEDSVSIKDMSIPDSMFQKYIKKKKSS